MEPMVVISMLLGVIILLLFVGAPIKPIRFFGQVVVKVVIGVLLLFFLNAFGALVGYHIPFNFATIAISSFLGVPGLVLLVAIDYFIL